jgi:hypothetical protein
VNTTIKDVRETIEETSKLLMKMRALGAKETSPGIYALIFARIERASDLIAAVALKADALEELSSESWRRSPMQTRQSSLTSSRWYEPRSATNGSRGGERRRERGHDPPSNSPIRGRGLTDSSTNFSWLPNFRKSTPIDR